MNLTGKSIIGFASGAGGTPTLHGVNPATGEKLESPYSAATPDELNRAADLAASASAIYGRKSGKERAAFLRAIADKIESQIDDFAARATAETALPEGRIRGENGRTVGQLRLFASTIEDGSWAMPRIDPALPDRKPLPRPDIRSLLRPLGPVVVFGASNFPLAFSVAGGDTASALAAGCPVIAVAHPGHPGTAELAGAAIRDAARECGMPEGVFSLIYGVGFENGVALVKHPKVKAVGFTGSRKGGMALVHHAAARPEPIPVYAEMSSVNPVFILPSALKSRGEEIAKGLAGSITLGAGQFCTNPGIIVLAASAESKALSKQLTELQTAAAPATMLHAGIREGYVKGVAALAAHQGVTTLANNESGGAPGSTSAAQATSAAQVGTALFETDAKTFLAYEAALSAEVFGPSSMIVQHETHEDLLAIARGLEGQLTATIHGTPEDLTAHADLIAILETKVGRLIFNGYPTGVEVCPAMVHGGPFPATSDGRSTSVGTMAINRFTRPVCYQSWPDAALPDELQNANPLGVWRLVDGKMTNERL